MRRISVLSLSFLLGFSLIFSGCSQPAAPDILPSKTEALTVKAADQIRGDTNAKVVMIEYSDFQCPHCADASVILDQLMTEMGDQVQLVHRHFPLGNNKKSVDAAVAAEAAGRQNKFFEMTSKLFASQNEWAQSNQHLDLFAKYATDLGLDANKFKQDMQDGSLRDKVNKDRLSGLALQVDSPPTFIINGIKTPNPGTIENFKQVIASVKAQ